MSRDGRNVVVEVPRKDLVPLTGCLVQELQRFGDREPGTFGIVAPSVARATLIEMDEISSGEPCSLHFMVRHEGGDTVFQLVAIDNSGDR